MHRVDLDRPKGYNSLEESVKIHFDFQGWTFQDTLQDTVDQSRLPYDNIGAHQDWPGQWLGRLCC